MVVIIYVITIQSLKDLAHIVIVTEETTTETVKIFPTDSWTAMISHKFVISQLPMISHFCQKEREREKKSFKKSRAGFHMDLSLDNLLQTRITLLQLLFVVVYIYSSFPFLQQVSTSVKVVFLFLLQKTHKTKKTMIFWLTHLQNRVRVKGSRMQQCLCYLCSPHQSQKLVLPFFISQVSFLPGISRTNLRLRHNTHIPT